MSQSVTGASKRVDIVTGVVTEYTWDHRNRLVQIVEKDSRQQVLRTVPYRYEPMDRRMAKVVAPAVGPATVEHFIYDGAARQVDDDKQIAFRFGTAGTVINRYLCGPAVDQILADEQVDPGTGQVTDVLWPLADQLGAVRDLASYDEQTGITSIANTLSMGPLGKSRPSLLQYRAVGEPLSTGQRVSAMLQKPRRLPEEEGIIMKRVLPGLLLCVATAPAAEVTVLTPPVGEQAYQIAGEQFANLWEQVTGRRPVLQRSTVDQRIPSTGDVVLIGSDAVQPVVHQLIRDGLLGGLQLQYGADNYRLLAIPHQGRQLVILAGGTGRSTIYAVYDFFHRQVGAEYFWDGDRIPRRDTIDLAGLDVLQQPHFAYRGLRYFAHRGLHRFQAEHWDLNDWQREIDWLLKKRFNLFMLRTGIDDLFQRAFPGEVAYPPTDGQDPDAEDRSYNDRTSFWPLRYRGELRKQILQYARNRGLLHPEDTGTITHWYSHTPSSFYASHPGFPVITDQKSGYKLSTHAIWDIEDQKTWDTYWQLTETHIREFGGGAPRLFHTIGMAERTFGSSDRDNLQRKLYVYRKTQQMIREHYPDTPLLIASWDFIGWKWTDEDVRRLTEEFDPRRTIMLDYTADMAGKATFRDWGLPGRFPWIFGIFHSFARNSDVHEDYTLLGQRLSDAVADPQCLGLVLWSEISHSDTFLLEYLAENSWEPHVFTASDAADRFCQARYPDDLSRAMRPVWADFLQISQTQHWSIKSAEHSLIFSEPQFRLLQGGWVTLTPPRLTTIDAAYRRLSPPLRTSPAMLTRLAELSARWYSDALWRRDALDMARTIANRALFVSLAQGALSMEAWRQGQAEPASIQQVAELNLRLYDALANLLAQSDDFSQEASLRRLSRARALGDLPPLVNLHAEQTLKANAENSYCRSHHYELVHSVNRREAECYWKWVQERIARDERGPWRQSAELTAAARDIADDFYATPLAKLKPVAARGPAELAACLQQLARAAQALVDSERGDR